MTKSLSLLVAFSLIATFWGCTRNTTSDTKSLPSDPKDAVVPMENRGITYATINGDSFAVDGQPGIDLGRQKVGAGPSPASDTTHDQDHNPRQSAGTASWIPARPGEVTVSAGTARVLDDHSVRLDGDVPWQEVTAYFTFDNLTTIQELRLELLPVDTPSGRQFGRVGETLMLVDVKPRVEKQAGESAGQEFISCVSLQNPDDDTIANCIDHLSDTGWTVPALPADATAHHLILSFDEPVTLQPGQRLLLSVDSGGSDDLAVLNRIRFAFHQDANEKPHENDPAASPQSSKESDTSDSVPFDRHQLGTLQPQGKSSETGTVVLYAVDADSGEPIRDVTFVKENAVGELWATTVGKTGDDGTVQLETKPLPGYFFSILPVPDGYKVSSLDEVPSHVKVGSRVEHRFHLRKLGTNLDFLKPFPISNSTVNRFANALRHSDKDWVRFVIDDMPGFAEQQITFSFEPRHVRLAELIFRNGKRVRSAVRNELSYFQKAEGASAGEISEIYDVKIVIGKSIPRVPATTWHLYFRTKNGIELKQDGFSICFEDLDHWDLEIPAYLHPEF